MSPTSVDLKSAEKSLKNAIERGKIIRLISYAMTIRFEKTMDMVINCILDKYKKPELQSIVYTCTKELALNGTKANIKRIFFEENKLDITNEADYEKGVQLYKDVIKEEEVLKYGPKVKQKGLFVKISFIHNKDVLKIEVLNNTEMTRQEETRLRQKFSQVMKYDDLMEYYMDHADDTEGAGLGLALIMILLMAEGINPGFFRVGIEKNITIARLEIPLSKDFICERERDHIIRIHD
ncbi:MAG: hypothetical protein JXB88_01810 [Spirochaetales bacterium]|nr:hypothetical protein [Spirochaetales bacterium]